MKIRRELTGEFGLGEELGKDALNLQSFLLEVLDGTRGVKVGGGNMTELHGIIWFPDEQVILLEKMDYVNTMALELNMECREFGMKINKDESKCMLVGGKNEKSKLSKD